MKSKERTRSEILPSTNNTMSTTAAAVQKLPLTGKKVPPSTSGEGEGSSRLERNSRRSVRISVPVVKVSTGYDGGGGGGAGGGVVTSGNTPSTSRPDSRAGSDPKCRSDHRHLNVHHLFDRHPSGPNDADANASGEEHHRAKSTIDSDTGQGSTDRPEVIKMEAKSNSTLNVPQPIGKSASLQQRRRSEMNEDVALHYDRNKRRKTEVKHNTKSLRSMIYGFNLSAEREAAQLAKMKRRQRIQEEKAMQAAPSAPIDASKFVAYVTERRKKRILFKGEYLMIQRSVDASKCHSDVAQTMGDRNQYPDTLPYDYNRVILRRLPRDENSHYVNASYVNSWLRERAYVVTQAVKTKPALGEFWRMIWELTTNCLVMLTKVFDFMRVVCLQYWPVNSAQYGDIHVETLSTKTYAHFVIRTLRLTRHDADVGLQTRMVKQFHFTEWELDSFPYISAFIEFRRRVRRYVDRNRSDAPVVVHCSNGGGRSGAFLSLDANLELMKKTGQIDVFEYAKTMVNSRPHLVDSVDQYQFIYDCLAEAVLCDVEPIAMWQLKERSSMYKARRDRQLMEAQDAYENKLLMMLTPTLRIGDCAGGHRLENRGKNRDVMVVPPDHARPYLQTLHGESKDYTYINAVEVDGFTRKNEFIVTEWPKHSTIDSFWTLVFDHSCHTIVNLSNQGNARTYPTFLHSKGKRTYGPFVVEILNYHQYPSMTSHMVKVMKKTFMISEIMASGASQQQLEAEVRICCVIQVRMWPIENKVPLSTSGLIDMIKMARSWRRRAPDRPETKPTIVMSHNGVSRCGIFIAANVCIDQMNMDHEVDVFHTVKMIRINRPQLIDMKDEYKYLYDLMLHWYMTNAEYRQFDERSEDDSPNAQQQNAAATDQLGARAAGSSCQQSASTAGNSAANPTAVTTTPATIHYSMDGPNSSGRTAASANPNSGVIHECSTMVPSRSAGLAAAAHQRDIFNNDPNRPGTVTSSGGGGGGAGGRAVSPLPPSTTTLHQHKPNITNPLAEHTYRSNARSAFGGKKLAPVQLTSKSSSNLNICSANYSGSSCGAQLRPTMVRSVSIHDYNNSNNNNNNNNNNDNNNKYYLNNYYTKSDTLLAGSGVAAAASYNNLNLAPNSSGNWAATGGGGGASLRRNSKFARKYEREAVALGMGVAREVPASAQAQTQAQVQTAIHRPTLLLSSSSPSFAQPIPSGSLTPGHLTPGHLTPGHLTPGHLTPTSSQGQVSNHIPL